MFNENYNSEQTLKGFAKALVTAADTLFCSVALVGRKLTNVYRKDQRTALAVIK